MNCGLLSCHFKQPTLCELLRVPLTGSEQQLHRLKTTCVFTCTEPERHTVRPPSVLLTVTDRPLSPTAVWAEKRSGSPPVTSNSTPAISQDGGGGSYFLSDVKRDPWDNFQGRNQRPVQTFTHMSRAVKLWRLEKDPIINVLQICPQAREGLTWDVGSSQTKTNCLSNVWKLWGVAKLSSRWFWLIRAQVGLVSASSACVVYDERLC